MNRLLPLGLLLLAAAARSADFVKPPANDGGLAYNKDFMSGILQAFMSPKGVNMTRLLEAFHPTPCLQKCMPSLSQFLDSFNTKQSLRDTKDTAALCKQLESIDECAASSHCDSSLLDLATKTYKFACMEKIESLGDSLKCAQDAFAGSRADCETGCIVDRSALDAALNSVDPAKLPVDVSSICESSVCLLGCMQRSINAACVTRGGNTPTLFSAILTTSTSNDDNTLSSFFSGMLPMQCRDVLKAQTSLPERIAQLAAIGQNSLPHSVGKPKALPEPPATTTTTTVAPSTTTTTTTTSSPSTTVLSTTPTTTTVPAHPLLWAPAPIEAPIDVDGEARTLQCSVLDWERRPVASPTIERLARLIAEQYLTFEGMQTRADDGDMDSSSNGDSPAFRRWLATHDAESYRAIGFGASTYGEGAAIPSLRANSAAGSDGNQPSSYPSWTNLALAGVFPFVIYLMD